MTEERLPSKFTFILHADIAGSTALVQQDEDLAHKRIRDTFRRFSDLITKYHGHVREIRGDALLAEFERASDAVTAALAFQKDQSEFLAQLDDPILPKVRVGIAMGEVIVADNTVTGEGVVLAQRVEQLADPGGVCITGAIHEALPRRMPFDQDDLGEREVKGFDEPVRVYAVRLKEGAILPTPTIASEPKRTSAVQWIMVAAVVVLICGGGLLAWLQPWKPDFEPVSPEAMVQPLPAKPSIAVLAFDDLSAGEDQGYLSDAISEGIITKLSHFSELFVIARNSSFFYKGKATDVRDIAAELGTRYILEGSQQKAREKLRVTVQLVDALTGNHIWSGTYDRDLVDLFAVQDEIANTVASTVGAKVIVVAAEEAKRGDPKRLQAFQYWLKGTRHWYEWTKEGNEKARLLYLKAVDADPDLPRGHLGLAWVNINGYRWGWTDLDRDEALALARKQAQRGLDLAPQDYFPHQTMAYVLMQAGEREQAIVEFEKSLTLNPNASNVMMDLAEALVYSGRAPEAIELMQRAMRLDPHHPDWFYWNLGWAQWSVGAYEKALATMNKMSSMPNLARRTLANIYVGLNRLDEARATIAELLENDPEYSMAEVRTNLGNKYKNLADAERFIDGLRKAGLPENPPLKLPDKPSIAVLAFDNLSGDSGQDYLSDGITESLITRLARQPDMFVIARNSSFTYKGKPVKVQQVGRELGVRYVLEGSVQKSGDRIRIIAQLIEATTGQHLWTDSYDRELQDLFAVQDEITQKVATELAVKLTIGDTARFDVRATDNVEAYDYWLRGVEAYRQFKKESNIQAGEWFEKAIELDPQYARAIGWLGWVRLNESRFWWVEDREASLQQAEELAQQAIGIDENSTIGHNLLSRLYSHKGRHEEAIAEGRRTIAIEPSHASAYASLAYTMVLAGKPEEGQDFIRTALRLSPYAPLWFINIETNVNYLSARYEEAIASGRRFLARSQEGVQARDTWRLVISSYVELGRDLEARAEAKKYIELDPKFSVKEEGEWRKGFVYRDKSWIDRYIETLRKAGLPE